MRIFIVNVERDHAPGWVNGVYGNEADAIAGVKATIKKWNYASLEEWEIGGEEPISKQEYGMWDSPPLD